MLLLKAVSAKFVNSLGAKAGIHIKKGQKEEQKFDREIQPPEVRIGTHKGKTIVTIDLKFLFKGITRCKCIRACCLDM